MNRAKLKTYAPRARRDFIQAMTDRAAYYGLTATKTEPVLERGDVALIGGREFSLAIARKRKRLEDRIQRDGYDQTMESLAYTWFNRFVAIRYMELHGYLDHGYRVLSSRPATDQHGKDTEEIKTDLPQSNSPFRVSSVSVRGPSTPELLLRAEHVNLPGLTQKTVIDLKLAGNKENELYRLLLTAQCNALNTAMPFLFKKIDDEAELLLPENLLHSDSLIRKLVDEIEEVDWNEVEIIGWLYQFYISDKKDEVIGKVVASEDIPAATQLFTPNWIVKYLVQNTLGRQWLATYPQSALRQQMEYYIEPAEQTPEVQEQLRAITPTSLNPEELTLLDPACGSGHILVEAYDLFKAIYQERGYSAKGIPALILQKNLFGLEIDDRAAQLAAFALMMKARADDRRIFDSQAKPNILAFVDSQGMNAADITHALNSPLKKDATPREFLFEEVDEKQGGLLSKKVLAEKGHVSRGDIASLVELFEHAKTFGSLIQVPEKLATNLQEIEKRVDDVLKHGDLTHASAHVIKPILKQADFLLHKYSCVVANPPYMGIKGLNMVLKNFGVDFFPEGKTDLFSMFILRITSLVSPAGQIGLMTPFVWMFLQTYTRLRKRVLSLTHINSLIQPEYHAFFDSAFVPICAFTLDATPFNGPATFIRLTEFYGTEVQAPKALEAIQSRSCSWRFEVNPSEFELIPNSPIAYWLPQQVIQLFASWSKVKDFATAKVGLQTSDNEKFVRLWHEVVLARIGFGFTLESQSLSKNKWFPFNKGGLFRKWAGNIGHVVNWESNGHEIKGYKNSDGRLLSRPQNADFYFSCGITWSDITSSDNSYRWLPNGVIPSNVAHMAYFEDMVAAKYTLAFVNSSIGVMLANALSPTMHFNPGDFEQLPIPIEHNLQIVSLADAAIAISENDWNLNETSWGFRSCDIKPGGLLSASYLAFVERRREASDKLKKLECDIDNHFRAKCGITAVSVDSIRITLHEPVRDEDIKRLISYAIGCLMGRYCLDKPGLIYAHSGNEGFDRNQYITFRADDDGIVPLLETDWGIRDDAANRIFEFVSVAWSNEHLEENLKFIADSLSPNNGEQPRDTIRLYLATGFYKHHLQMYKKRPIYWLFSSGKRRAFQCFVYLHRYNDGTLSRMRTEYVIPLQGHFAARIEQLAVELAKPNLPTSHRKKLQKEQDDLKKQQAELITFDEKLRHVADQKISLDLDDGVKVNYAKFGDLLAESKAITGGKDEE